MSKSKKISSSRYSSSRQTPSGHSPHRREIIMDTETTGIDPWNGERLTEICLVEMIDGKMTGEYLHLYVNPEKKVSPFITKLTGLTNDFLSKQPKFSEVADRILEFIGDSRLVFHARAGDWDGGFDPGFLNAELMRANRLPLDVRDNYNMRRDAELLFLPRGMSSSLSAVCEYFGVNPDDEETRATFEKFGLDVEALRDRSGESGHSALLDTVMTAMAYPRLKKRARGLLVNELANGGPRTYRPGMEELGGGVDYKYIGPGQMREMTEGYLCDEFRKALYRKQSPVMTTPGHSHSTSGHSKSHHEKGQKKDSQTRAKKRKLRNRIRLF